MFNLHFKLNFCRCICSGYCIQSNIFFITIIFFSSDSNDTRAMKKRSEKDGRGRKTKEGDKGRSRNSSRGSNDSSNDREWRKERSPDSRSPVRDRQRRERDRERERKGDKGPEQRKRSEDREAGRSVRGRERGRRRSSSSDSSCSSGSDNVVNVVKEKEEKKKQKEMMKALETPEEKRARRLAKKEAKEKKRREKMGWSEEYMGYTNADNPFGDNNLLGTFKWKKVIIHCQCLTLYRNCGNISLVMNIASYLLKMFDFIFQALDKKGIGHLGEKELKERNKQIQEENRRELQKAGITFITNLM